MAIPARAPANTADVLAESSGTLAVNATDLATAITLVNEVKQVLINAGLAK